MLSFCHFGMAGPRGAPSALSGGLQAAIAESALPAPAQVDQALSQATSVYQANSTYITQTIEKQKQVRSRSSRRRRSRSRWRRAALATPCTGSVPALTTRSLPAPATAARQQPGELQGRTRAVPQEGELGLVGSPMPP